MAGILVQLGEILGLRLLEAGDNPRWYIKSVSGAEDAILEPNSLYLKSETGVVIQIEDGLFNGIDMVDLEELAHYTAINFNSTRGVKGSWRARLASGASSTWMFTNGVLTETS